MLYYIKKYFSWLCCVILVTSCSKFAVLHKNKPTVALSLPVSRQEEPIVRVADSIQAPPKEIVFVRADGEEVPLNATASWDSIHKENITNIALDEVVISAQTRRNTAERDGMINLEFIVTVPLELQNDNWMVNVVPTLKKGEVESDSLKELRFTGIDFRKKQESDYRRYHRFLDRIIPDTVDFYRTFVNYNSFERYLKRLAFQKRSLERKWTFLEAKRLRPDPTLERFKEFNMRRHRNDSLLFTSIMRNAVQEIAKNQENYDELSRQLEDTVRYVPSRLLERFRLFNDKSYSWENKMNERAEQRKVKLLDKLKKDSLKATKERLFDSRTMNTFLSRKEYFHNSIANAKKRVKLENSNTIIPPLMYDRFAYFNDKMQNNKEKLTKSSLIKAKEKAHKIKKARASKQLRKESDKELDEFKSLVAAVWKRRSLPSDERLEVSQGITSGREDTTKLERDASLKTNTNFYNKFLAVLPMYNIERPLDDSTYIASRSSRWRRLRKLSNYSQEDIKNYFSRAEISRKPKQVVKDTVVRTSLMEMVGKALPVNTLRREIPDSIYYVHPSKRLLKKYEEAKFNSDEILSKYQKRYEKRRNRLTHFNLNRELDNIYSPRERYLAMQKELEEDINRIAALDSTDLMKRFYDARKIARNEAKKAQTDEKFRELIRFPYNPEAKLDTVINAADKVYYLFSEKIPADENTSRLYVYLNGNVVDHSGNEYALPTSDTLTYFVSSMTKFVDETPRYVQRVVTRDAEATTKINFTFPTGKTEIDRTLGNNEKELTRVKELTTALMTDPVYIIDSLTLYSGSSPEGSSVMNERLSRGRAESIKKILISDFRVLYDSLNISMAVMLDEQGNIMKGSDAPELPNLPKLLRVKWLAENWQKLSSLIVNDETIEHRNDILEIISTEVNMDKREMLIRSKFPKDYKYMREKLYPEVRSVDFVFSLHRRGMQKDTLYTTELDQRYADGVELLKKRKYEDALQILRSYEDVNTAIAYMSLGYDDAALRILNEQPEKADVRYLQAILEYRLGSEERAVLRFMRACEMNQQLKFRGNLDPELSTLIKKYELFKEDDMW